MGMDVFSIFATIAGLYLLLMIASSLEHISSSLDRESEDDDAED